MARTPPLLPCACCRAPKCSPRARRRPPRRLQLASPPYCSFGQPEPDPAGWAAGGMSVDISAPLRPEERDPVTLKVCARSADEATSTLEGAETAPSAVRALCCARVLAAGCAGRAALHVWQHQRASSLGAAPPRRAQDGADGDVARADRHAHGRAWPPDGARGAPAQAAIVAAARRPRDGAAVHSRT